MKCKKCRKEATKEDGLCDSCRFLIMLDGILRSREGENCGMST